MPRQVCGAENGPLLSPGLAKFGAAIEPGSDPFSCERYAADLGAIFQKWSAAIRGSSTGIAPIADVLAPDIGFVRLDEFERRTLCHRLSVQVDVLRFTSAPANGKSAFIESVAAYMRRFTGIRTAEFLITGLRIVRTAPVMVDITVRYDLVGRREDTATEERTGTWLLSCQADANGKWQIDSWHAADEIRSALQGRGFVDITAQALAGNTVAEKQLACGVDFWRSSIDAASGIDVYGNNGIAVGDFDGDGLDDFYVCQPPGLPNRLFRNRGDGTFEDVTESSGLGLLDGTASALFADFTNTGTQDLLVVRTNGPLLYLNGGKGKFELKPDAFRFAKPPAGTFTGVAAADYDRDGFLDVYFCIYAYYQGLSQYTHPRPYYDAQNGPPNFLMHNRGDGTFEDVTDVSGMGENNNRYSFACGWCDYDNDGWPDLYVANDFGRKNLYRNREGKFHDAAREAGVEDFGAGMSVSWFDCDNNLRQDLYVTDMYSAAGTRVTSQDVFLPGIDAEIRKAYRKHAGGNSLFLNASGSDGFADATSAARLAMGRWSWSSDSWDFDHDGTADLYVTNGFISGTNRTDLSSFFWRQIVARSLDTGSASVDYELAWNAINELIRSDYTWNGYERNVFFVNNGDGTFAELSGPLGLDFTDDSRAFALADFDGDGRLELLLKNRTGPQLRILRNELDPIGKSVIFRLRGTKSNRDAIGAVITVETGSLKQVKFVQAGSGFLSQHTKDVCFGLGSSPGPLRVTIRWPSGMVQKLENLPSQHHIAITEGVSDWQGQPFASARQHPGPPRGLEPIAALPSSFSSWLIEPLPAMPFSLPCLDGSKRDLKSFAGKPLLLVLIRASCEADRAYVSTLAASFGRFQARGVQIAVLYLDAGAAAAHDLTEQRALPFPVLLADKSATEIYRILYRYLFDRRRDLEGPLQLLVDHRQNICKVAQGPVDPAQLLTDFGAIPVTAEARLARALPFKGHFQGEAPRRNFFTYGIAFIQNDYPDAALTCFQTAVERNPNYAPAHYNIGTIYLNKQMLTEAKASLERAVALDPDDADALTNLGAVAGQQKDYDTAYRYFEAALLARPNHLLALQNLVLIDRWKGRLDKAQQAIQKAIAVEPNEPEFHFALGMLFASQDKFEDARVELDRAVELRPNDPVSLNNLGVVFLRIGKQSEAADSFERCMRMAPDYDRPFLNLASIYQQHGQLEKAREILKDFLARHPDNTELAQALQALGR